jgi:hypothetical protein
MSCCAKLIRKSRQKKYKKIYDKYKRFLIENENAKKIPTNLSSASYTIYDNYENDTSSETIREPYQPPYHYREEFTKEDIRILKNIFKINI